MRVLSFGVEDEHLAGIINIKAQTEPVMYNFLKDKKCHFDAVVSLPQYIDPHFFRIRGVLLPLILLTFSTSAEYRASLLDRGADVCLSFPVNAHEVRASIFSAVRRQHRLDRR